MSLRLKLIQFCLFFFDPLLSLIPVASVNDVCWSSTTFYTISAENSSSLIQARIVSEIDLVKECHLSFVQNISNKTCVGSSGSSLRSPTLSQKYGFGFLAVFIISVLSLAGFLAFPLMKKPYYKYINAFFVALAVGTLYADTAFELFPVIIQYALLDTHRHEHGQIQSENSGKKKLRVSLFLWQMTVLVLTSYVFYMIELIIHLFMHRATPKNAYDLHLHDVRAADHGRESIGTSPEAEPNGLIGTATDLPPIKSTGWVVIIGDGIHNIADGLAIGAAFAENVIFGLTTAIAIACHELPTELGEYMVLIESGFTLRRALLFNFISACTAIIGFFIGASIAENEAARIWIFVITAGTFTYIALVALWPTLMPATEQFDWIRFTCVTIGYLLGVFVMFILTIFEDIIVTRDTE